MLVVIKKTVVTVLLSEKVYFRGKSISRHKESKFIMVSG